MQSSHLQEQLIDEERKYYEDNFSKVSAALTKDQSSKSYYIISIIGVQNSGKSTLLNHLFGTQFKVLTATAGTQTTKGIWISKDKQKPLLVLDVEGNDSIERASENDNNFEKTVAMYALALSNLLIVNIWAKSVGTFEGSQYGILKILMEMSLKMFKQEAPKVILFCLRDFNQDDNLQYVTTTITDDVQKIWNSIQKPQNLLKTPRDKFFKIKVHPLRRYRANRTQDFIEDANILRNKMTDPNNPDYLFAGIQQNFNLPLKDLQDLSKNAWSAVIQNKDLNLPNQKIQLANLRCNTVKDDIIAQFSKQLQELTRKPFSSKLKQDIQKLVNDKTLKYEQQTKGYDKKVIKEKQQLLRSGISQKIQDQVQRISKIKRDELVSRFQGVKVKSFEKSISLQQHLNKSVKDIIEQFDRFMDDIKFTFPHKREMLNNFQQTLRSMASNKQKQLQEQIKQDFDVSARRLVSEEVSDLISNNLDQNFWKRAQKAFNLIYDKQIGKYSESHSWITNQKLSKNQTDEKKQALYSQLKTEIRNKLQIILVEKLLQKFNKKFTKDPEGNTHNWLVMEDKKIEEIFENAREDTLFINRALNQVPNFSIDQSQTLDGIKQELFQPNKLSKINDDLQSKMTQQYENTIRSKKQTQMSKVPWYLWLIFVFFTYDDIWFGEDHPFVYYPSMIIISILALLLSMGYKDQLFAFFTYFLNKLKEKFSFLR